MAGEQPIRRRLVVHGTVQGVFFRDSTRESAERAGVSGSARNCRDGTVEVVLEGLPASVARVEQFCRTGPPQASVSRVDATDEPPEGLAGFRIR